jgi:hypothetical protein
MDGDVVSAFIASDGVPCVAVKECDMPLLAAAPDLLEALRLVMARSLSMDPFTHEAVRAAIAKAEGR